MSSSVRGIYGGLARLHGDDVSLKFSDGTVKAINAGALKAGVEDYRSFVAEGITILPDPQITHIYYGKLTLVFSTAELFNMF
ncbi:MAG: hypothetical protein AAB622_01225 [Patescibacteria group bacterium]